MTRTRGHGVARAVFAVAVAAVASGCGSDSPQGPSGSAAGQAIYEASCAACHGVELEGTDKGPSHLSVVYRANHHPDDAFRAAIRDGSPQHHWNFGDMPPVKGLSDEEVELVIAYIRAEQTMRGFQE